MKKAEIKYPCLWTYRIIGTDKTLLQQLVTECLAQKKYELTAGNTSSKGKYISLNLETRVTSQKERDDIFHRLNNSPVVKMII